MEVVEEEEEERRWRVRERGSGIRRWRVVRPREINIFWWVRDLQREVSRVFVREPQTGVTEERRVGKLKKDYGPVQLVFGLLTSSFRLCLERV